MERGRLVGPLRVLRTAEGGKTNSMKKFVAWVELLIAVVAVLTTPSAIIDAIHWVHSEHKLALVIPIAFAIRFGIIWWFIKSRWANVHGGSSSEKAKEPTARYSCFPPCRLFHFDSAPVLVVGSDQWRDGSI